MEKKQEEKCLQFVLRHYKEDALNTSAALHSVQRRTGTSQQGLRTGKWRRRVAAAAAVLALALAGAAVLSWPRSDRVQLAEAGTFLLPDSSRATLDEGAILTYDRRKKRAVSMSGRIYFDVRHNEEQPFTVETEEAQVVVLGTKFMVETDTGAAVYVEEGRVRLSAKGQNEGLILTKGRAARLEHGSLMPHPTAVATNNQTSWATGRLHFDDTPLELVLRDVEQYYHTRLSCATPGRRLTADFEADKCNIDEILTLIEQTLDVHIQVVSD